MKNINLNKTPTAVEKTDSSINKNVGSALPGAHVTGIVKKQNVPSTGSDNGINTNEANVAQSIVAPNDTHLQEYNKFLAQQNKSGSGLAKVVQDFFSVLNLPMSLIEGGIGATARAINGHDQNAGGFFKDLWDKGVGSQFTSHPYMGTNMIEDLTNNQHLFDKTGFWGKLGISLGVDFIVSLPLTVLSGGLNVIATAGEAAEKIFAKTSEELASHAVGDVAEKDLSEGAKNMLANLRKNGKAGLYESSKNRVESMSKNIVNSSQVSNATKKTIVKGFLKKSLRTDSGHEDFLANIKTKTAWASALQFAINPNMVRGTKIVSKSMFNAAKEGKLLSKNFSKAYVKAYTKNSNFVNGIMNKLSINRGLSIENKELSQKVGRIKSGVINDINKRVDEFKGGIRDLTRRIMSKNSTPEETKLFQDITNLHKKISLNENIGNHGKIQEIEDRVLAGNGTKEDKATIHGWFHSTFSYSNTNHNSVYHIWKGKNGDAFLSKLARTKKNDIILPGYDVKTFDGMNDFLRNVLGSSKDYIRKVGDNRVEIHLTDGDINRIKVLDKNKDKVHLSIANTKLMNRIILKTKATKLKILSHDAFHAGLTEKNKFLPATTKATPLFKKFDNTPFEQVLKDKEDILDTEENVSKLQNDLSKLPKEEKNVITKKVGASTKNIEIDKEVKELENEIKTGSHSLRDRLELRSEIDRLNSTKEAESVVKETSKLSKKTELTNLISKQEDKLKKLSKKYHYINVETMTSHIEEDSEKYSKAYQGVLGRHHLANQLDKKIVLSNDKDVNDLLKPIEKSSSYKKIAGDGMNMFKTHKKLYTGLIKGDPNVYDMEKYFGLAMRRESLGRTQKYIQDQLKRSNSLTKEVLKLKKDANSKFGEDIFNSITESTDSDIINKAKNVSPEKFKQATEREEMRQSINAKQEANSNIDGEMKNRTQEEYDIANKGAEEQQAALMGTKYNSFRKTFAHTAAQANVIHGFTNSLKTKDLASLGFDNFDITKQITSAGGKLIDDYKITNWHQRLINDGDLAIPTGDMIAGTEPVPKGLRLIKGNWQDDTVMKYLRNIGNNNKDVLDSNVIKQYNTLMNDFNKIGSQGVLMNSNMYDEIRYTVKNSTKVDSATMKSLGKVLQVWKRVQLATPSYLIKLLFGNSFNLMSGNMGAHEVLFHYTKEVLDMKRLGKIFKNEKSINFVGRKITHYFGHENLIDELKKAPYLSQKDINVLTKYSTKKSLGIYSLGGSASYLNDVERDDISSTMKAYSNHFANVKSLFRKFGNGQTYLVQHIDSAFRGAYYEFALKNTRGIMDRAWTKRRLEGFIKDGAYFQGKKSFSELGQKDKEFLSSEIAKFHMVDYTESTAWQRQYLGKIIPFLNYQKANYARQLFNFLERPAYRKFAADLQESPTFLSPQQRKSIPTFMNNIPELPLFVGNSVVFSKIPLPTAAPFTFFSPSTLFSVSPYIKTLMGFFTDRDLSTGGYVSPWTPWVPSIVKNNVNNLFFKNAADMPGWLKKAGFRNKRSYLTSNGMYASYDLSQFYQQNMKKYSEYLVKNMNYSQRAFYYKTIDGLKHSYDNNFSGGFSSHTPSTRNPFG